MQLNNEVQLIPLGDKVLTKVLPSDQVTKSGLILPGGLREAPQMAEVLALGRGRVCKCGVLPHWPIKVGDKVIYERFSGTQVKAGGEVFLHLEDLMAVLK